MRHLSIRCIGSRVSPETVLIIKRRKPIDNQYVACNSYLGFFKVENGTNNPSE